MNWTGGRLQRHSTNNRGASARQRQHFAKVNQNLRTGPKKDSPIKLSIFNHVVRDQQRSQRGSSAIESVASHHSDRSQSQQPQKLPATPNLRPWLESKHASEVQTSQQDLRTPVRRQASHVPDDDLYNATPPPRISKIKREHLEEIPAVEEVEELDNSMLEKRRRLLRKGDWVGVNIQKPIGIKFVASMVEENVGRRKRLTDGHRARYQSRQTHIESPFASKRRRLGSPSMEDSHPLQQRTDVKISIGGKVVPPGISSSSAGGRGGSRLLEDGRRSYTGSSDVMLLDGDDRVEMRASEEYRSSILDAQSRDIHRARTPFRPHRIQGVIPDQQDTSSPVQRTQRRRIDTVLLSSDDEDEEDRGGLDDISGSNQEQSTSFGPPKSETKRSSSQEDDVILISSRPHSIHQPVPHRSRVSRFLQLTSSESFDTTLARVGQIERGLPRSQELENEAWKAWIAPNDENDGLRETSGTCYDHIVRKSTSISPGISIILAGQEVQRLNREEVVSSPLESPDLEDEAEEEEEEEDEENSKSVGSGPPQDEEESFGEECAVFADEVAVPEIIASPFRKFKSVEGKDAQKDPHPEMQKDNPGEVWRKFVFGSSSDDIDAPDPAPDFHTTQTLRQNNFSTMGTQGTDISTDSSRDLDDIQLVTEPVGLKSKSKPGIGTDQTPQANDGWTSTHTTNGSIIETGEASPLVFMATHTPSSSSMNSHVPGSVSSTSQRKIIFTKPKRFVGRASRNPREKAPLHLGRTFRDRMDKLQAKTNGTSINADVDGQNNSQDDVESIEDG